MKHILSIAFCAITASTASAADIYLGNLEIDSGRTDDGTVFVGTSSPSPDALSRVDVTGGSWTVNESVIVGAGGGTGTVVVAQGGKLTARTIYTRLSRDCQGGLFIGGYEGSTGVVTNKGSVEVNRLSMGVPDSAFDANFPTDITAGNGGSALFENFGALKVRWHFRMGVGANTPSVFVNHEGASFTHVAANDYSFYLGQYAAARFVNEGTMTLSPLDVINAGMSLGGTEIVFNKSGSLTNGKALCLGYSQGCSASLVMNDSSSLSAVTNVYLGWHNRSQGSITMNGSSTLSAENAYVGCVDETRGCTQSSGLFALNGSASATFTDLRIGDGANSTTGRVVVADSSKLSARISLGASDAAGTGKATLEMRGGTVTAAGLSVHADCDAEIRGWGVFKCGDWSRGLALNGAWIVADGEGEERTLNFASFPSPTAGGASAWKATANGLLNLPNASTSDENGVLCADVGGFALGNANAFCATLSSGESGTLVRGSIYAADRTDIPALEGIPLTQHGRMLTVLRIGHFDSIGTTRVAGTNVSVSFRYPTDDLPARADTMFVYRHDGTSWRAVGLSDISTVAPTVSASGFDTNTQYYNLGWFALVADRKHHGLSIIIR